MTFPFGQRTAEMLMEIAGHSILSNPKFFSNLPPSWGTLYEMTRIPEQELEKLIENGTINADIRRRDVEAIADEIRGEGFYKFDTRGRVLDRLALKSALRELPGKRPRADILNRRLRENTQSSRS